MTSNRQDRGEAVRTIAAGMEALAGVEVVKQKESTGTVSFRLTTEALSTGELRRLAPEGWETVPVLTPSDYKNVYVQRER
jgi:hypothetical protein